MADIALNFFEAQNAVVMGFVADFKCYLPNSSLNNALFECITKPYISIITATFNRESTISRTIKSVISQTYTNFEYIIVDDGSTDNTYSIVKSFIDTVPFPMLYVKKNNGGVHTARNLGISIARGKMYIGIDSDDELLPNALEIFVRKWEEIPSEKQQEYFEIKARCRNEKGMEIGERFPDDINLIDWSKAKLLYEKMKGEHIGFRRLDILKQNPWPEQSGVTFVTENIIWNKLRTQYKTYFINDVVRIYHTEGEDHIGFYNRKKKSLQYCRNAYFEAAYKINYKSIYISSFISLSKQIIKYHVMEDILLRHKVEYAKEELCVDDICQNRILFIVSKMISPIYQLIYRI